MPKVTGIFDSFDDLDLIPIADIARWLKVPPPLFFLENYLANRILYPQSAPQTKAEVDLDLAILREALRRNPSFLVSAEKKILIPEEFHERLPNLNTLAWAFVDAYRPKGVATINIVRKSGDEVVGMVIAPENILPTDMLKLVVENQSYEIKPGALMVIPQTSTHCHIAFSAKFARLLGKNETIFEGSGGSLGILVDGRVQ